MTAPQLTPAHDAPMLHESMTFGHAIDLYIADMRAEGRMTSDKTERSYRDCLNLHADDVGNRDPRYTNRQDVKRTLRRWENPNTQRVRRGCLVSFYDWAMQELEPGRKDNPARQNTPAAQAQVNRLPDDLAGDGRVPTRRSHAA